MTPTTDREYADLLARLRAIPAPAPERRTFTRQQEREQLLADLLNEQGESPF